MRLNVGNSPTTSRTLLTASATGAASPGSYKVRVSQLASAQKLAGAYVADPAAALGARGELRVNGRAVTVEATDTLNAIRDKFNAADAGGSASRVNASVLTVGGRSRLVLTSEATGASGIELNEVRGAADSGPALLDTLGLSDGTTRENVASDGTLQSARLSTISGTMLAALGVQTTPPPATLVVNGKQVTITADMTVSDVVARINQASTGAARTDTVTEGGATSYRLRIAGTIGAKQDGTPEERQAGERLLEAMGFTTRGVAASRQEVSTANALPLVGGLPAAGSTALTALGAVNGDTFTVGGTTRAGAAVHRTFRVGDPGAGTVQELMDTIAGAFGGTSSVDVSLRDGRFVVADKMSGDSNLAFSITSGATVGSALDLGATSVTAQGRTRELAQGQDARIDVDGATFVRSSNSIADAIGGVTLNLQQAEPDTTISVDVARDLDKGVRAVQDFARAFNDLQSFVDRETSASGRLAYNGAIRSSASSFKSHLLNDLVGLPDGAPYARAALVGVALTKTGTLEVDATALRGALESNLAGVQQLFGTAGRAAGAQFEYVLAGSSAQPGKYDVAVSRAATRSSVTGSAVAAPYGAITGTHSLTITDDGSGKSGRVALAATDTADSVASRLNALFTSEKLRMSASVESGALKIEHLDWGSTPGFTIAYADDGDGSTAAARIGVAAGRYHGGLDVQGTITRRGDSTGVTLTGSGQTLTGATGTPAEGLMVRYAGTAGSATTTLDYTLGLAGLMSRTAESMTGAGGFVSTQTGSTSGARR
jgi:flagellar hook-associated protein 2